MRVLFVCSGRQGGANPIIKNQGESLRRVGVELEYYVVYGGSTKGYVKNIKPLRKQIKEGHYDVVHAHYAFSAYLVNIATIGLCVPIVVSLMGSDIWTHSWYPLLVRMVANKWNAIIVKSVEMKYRVGISRANVLPNGVNMDVFNEQSKLDCQERLKWSNVKRHVLFPANPAVARKNWSLAENAVTLLNQSSKYAIDLHPMVGVKNEDTPILYNAADVVVLPSFYEGSANAVKEAMACNAPIVTTDMGDCRERIEGVKGCYVANTFEVEEFADLLGKALMYGDKSNGRDRLLLDGLADWQIAERLINIYKESMRSVKRNV